MREVSVDWARTSLERSFFVSRKKDQVYIYNVFELRYINV